MKKKINYIFMTMLLFISLDSVGAIERKCVVCGEGSLEIPALLPTFVSSLITLVQIFVPIILIVTGIVRYIKAVTSGEDKAISETNRSFIRSIITAIAIFLIVAIVRVAFNIVDKAGGENTTSCVTCFVNGKCDVAACSLRDGTQTTPTSKKSCSDYIVTSGGCPTTAEDGKNCKTVQVSGSSVPVCKVACGYLGSTECSKRSNDCDWKGIPSDPTPKCRDK